MNYPITPTTPIFQGATAFVSRALVPALLLCIVACSPSTPAPPAATATPKQMEFTGDLAEVEAAIAAAEDLLRKEGAFIQSEILARPHERIQSLVHEGLESLCFSRE